MTIQEELLNKGRRMVPYNMKLYDLSCFEECSQKEADFKLGPDGEILLANNLRNRHDPGWTYFRFKNGEILELIRETRRLDREVKNLRKELEEKENKLIELGYAKRLGTGARDLITLVSRDKEWLSTVGSIGAIYTNGGPREDAFLINGEI